MFRSYEELFLIITIILWVGAKEHSHDCGVVKVQNKFAPFHSYHGQWPWFGALFRIKNKTDHFFCGSSLINEWTLITAAHCIILGPNESISPRQIQAVLGQLNLANNSMLLKQKIEKTFSHEDYKGYNPNSLKPKSDADIALLIMKTKVNFSEFIQPICLSNSYEKTIERDGFIAGHGGLEGSSKPQNLTKYYKLSAKDQIFCYGQHLNSGNVLSDRSFCASSSNSEICRGDSGGGYYICEGMHSKIYKIQGLVSFSFRSTCKKGDLTVFVNVPFFVDWIERKAKGEVKFSNYFECLNGEIIPFHLKCNGKIDCNNSSDELNCLKGNVINSKTFEVNDTSLSNDDNTIHSPRDINITKFKAYQIDQIEHLPTRVAEVFPNLLDYEVTLCSVTKIKKKHFLGLNNLKIINLEENFIDHIESNAFDDLQQLEKLILAQNYLKSLDEKVFEKTKFLQSIDISSNEILDIPGMIFKSLENLKFLNIQGNKVKEIPSELFEKSQKIEIIVNCDTINYKL